MWNIAKLLDLGDEIKMIFLKYLSKLITFENDN